MSLSAAQIIQPLPDGSTRYVDAWGDNSLRIRIVPPGGKFIAKPIVQGLIADRPKTQSSVVTSETTLTNGNMRVVLSAGSGLATFSRVADGRVLLQERSLTMTQLGRGSPTAAAAVVFEGLAVDEYVYGLGEHRGSAKCHDQCTNASLPLRRWDWRIADSQDVSTLPNNGNAWIPWYASSRGVGFLWNLASYGSVHLGTDRVEWTSNATRQVDYWLTTTSVESEPLGGAAPGGGEGAAYGKGAAPGRPPYRDLMRHYATATGAPPKLPWAYTGFCAFARSPLHHRPSHTLPAPTVCAWAWRVFLGLTCVPGHGVCAWGHAACALGMACVLSAGQCKLRYSSQFQVERIAHGYRQRGLPLSVIVIDFHHWVHDGDWRFSDDPSVPNHTTGCWPSPSAMVSNLTSIGVLAAVSVWPDVATDSINFKNMSARGELIRGADSLPAPSSQGRYFVDAFNPAARDYFFGQLTDGYISHGIDTFWLDATEPQGAAIGAWYYRMDDGTTRRDVEVGMGWVQQYHRAVREGLEKRQLRAPTASSSAAAALPPFLSRSAFAGSQRYGAILWSGDIESTFDELAVQVEVAQHVAMSGVYLWTTDIGGFHGGDTTDPCVLRPATCIRHVGPMNCTRQRVTLARMCTGSFAS